MRSISPPPAWMSLAKMMVAYTRSARISLAATIPGEVSRSGSNVGPASGALPSGGSCSGGGTSGKKQPDNTTATVPNPTHPTIMRSGGRHSARRQLVPDRKRDRSGRRGQGERELAAHPDPALDPDPSAMSVDDASGDVEAEPDAASIVPADLVEPLEDGFQLVARDAHARIRDRETEVLRGPLDANEDLAACRGELDGVAEQVDEHLEDARGIELRRRRRRDDLGRQRNPAGGRLRPEGIHRL